MKFQTLAVAAVLVVSSSRLHAEPALTLEQRMERLEQENQQLHQQVDELKSAVTKTKMSHSIVTGEPLALPAHYDAAKVGAAFSERIDEWKAQQWLTGINPNGGGFFIKSPDEKFKLRLLGYAQAQYTVTDGANGLSFEEFDARIRRARLDFIADFYKRFELFIEIDAAPLGGTSLVEARLNTKVWDDKVQLRLGKFTTPFSTENFRSSRAIDTVERYIALNALFSVPALDVQTGGMIWGNIPLGKERQYFDRTASLKPPYPPGVTEDTLSHQGVPKKFRPQLTYYGGFWNGNASAGNENPSGFGGNSRDNNDAKEYQLKLIWQPHQHWTFGAAYDHNDSQAGEALTLSSLSGAPYIRTGVTGIRDGAEVDFLWEPGRFSFRGEGIYFDFKDEDLTLHGGFLQAAYFVTGDVSGGFQPVLRIENATLGGDSIATVDGHSINAVTAGFNWFLNGNVRVQLNYIGEYFDGPGNENIGNESYRNTVLGQMQFKF